MKKIIALALALIMALSMASVAFAVEKNDANGECVLTVAPGTDYTWELTGYTVAPGSKIVLDISTGDFFKGMKVSYDFTKDTFNGASYVESVKIGKDKDSLEIALKESYTLLADPAKELTGVVTVKDKTNTYKLYVDIDINNDVVEYLDGAKKLSVLDETVNLMEAKADTVQIMDEDGGFVFIDLGELTGTTKIAADAKVYFNAFGADEDTQDAINEVLGEDYEGIVEMYSFDTKGIGDVDFQYDAYEEDPHFFYAWDGEKLTAIEAKYDADEDVDNYVFTAKAEGTIVVTDTEVVLAAEEDTKNPDTGANDVVGVAAALAVVSLVAAGAVSLKK